MFTHTLNSCTHTLHSSNFGKVSHIVQSYDTVHTYFDIDHTVHTSITSYDTVHTHFDVDHTHFDTVS